MIEINLQIEEQGERLDIYLAQNLSDLSRSRLQQLIAQGNIQVNGKICLTKKAIVQKGDRIYIQIPDVQPLNLKAENIPLDILYEDDSLLIVNKPAGCRHCTEPICSNRYIPKLPVVIAISIFWLL